ncbi:MAG TPA: hypothetical protein VK479_16355 [Micropepsaceae bacterium]|nr:hypothetical protein [Micropepsaceae bacterium]
MRLFIGRFWSFRPEHLPFITFARAVYRDSLLADSAAGDRIAMVVTRKESVIPQNRGRLLGMAEIGAHPVDTADVVDSAAMTPREWLGGEPRCPKGIPMLRAWRFLQPPAVPVVIDAALPQTTGGPAILLTAKQATQITAFPYEAVPLRQSRWLLNGIPWAKDGTRRGDASGSAARPAETEQGEVLVLRFGSRDVWRIGNSFDPRRNIEAMNRDIPWSVTQERWVILYRRPISSEADALVCEMKLMELLMQHRIAGGFFACSATTIERVWNETLAATRIVWTKGGIAAS